MLLGAKAVTESCSDLMRYPDEDCLPVKKISIKALGMRNRDEPLEVTFLSDSQETSQEQSPVLWDY